MATSSSARVVAVAVLALLLAPAAASARGEVLAPAPARSLTTAVLDPAFVGTSGSALLARTRAAGASVVRLVVNWGSVAPSGARPPRGFNPQNPNDPRYHWAAVDAAVRAAVAHRLQPILCFADAPQWARHRAPPRAVVNGVGPYEPNATDYGRFARAAAERYDGRHGLPRVHYWQAWNEPNIRMSLSPLFADGRLRAPIIYRNLVNAFSSAVHSVRPANIVIAGGLSPFTITSGPGQAIGPMAFMRSMLCMSGGAHPRPSCGARSSFDVWAIHPYTSGNAFHKAFNRDDVSLGDLAKVRTMIAAAVKAGHVRSSRSVRLWVTEISWDTNPPDTNAVPIALQSRWAAEALWQCWRNGIDLVTWFMLRDQPFPSQPYQSGLYFVDDKPKPTLTAFRFPFVAYPRGGKTYVWGRTPDSKPHAVAIMRKLGYLGYQRVALVHANRYGVFQATIPFAAKVGFLHAQIGRDKSLDFSLKAPPDRFVHPFG